MNACGHNDASEFDTARNPVRRTTILSSLRAKARQRTFSLQHWWLCGEGVRQGCGRQPPAGGLRSSISHRCGSCLAQTPTFMELAKPLCNALAQLHQTQKVVMFGSCEECPGTGATEGVGVGLRQCGP